MLTRTPRPRGRRITRQPAVPFNLGYLEQALADAEAAARWYMRSAGRGSGDLVDEGLPDKRLHAIFRCNAAASDRASIEAAKYPRRDM